MKHGLSSVSDHGHETAWCDKFEIYGEPDEVLFMQEKHQGDNKCPRIHSTQKMQPPKNCSASHLVAKKHYNLYRICSFEVARGIYFHLRVRSKTPTHDLSPYFFLHFLSTTAGSWTNIEIHIRENKFYKMSTSELEHTFLYETLSYEAQRKLQSQTLKTNRDYFLLFLASRKDVSAPLSLTANLTSTFFTETSNKFEFNLMQFRFRGRKSMSQFKSEYKRLKCKTMPWNWMQCLEWISLEQKKEINFTFSKSEDAKIMSVGGSPSSLITSVANDKVENKIKLYWMHGSFDDFHLFLELEPKNCYLNQHSLNQCDYGLVFSSPSNKIYRFIRGHYVQQFKIKHYHLKEVKLSTTMKS